MKNTIERVWIAGAQGQVGSAFAQLLDSRVTEIYLTDVDDVNVTDADAVMAYGDMNRPDIIINCAGLTDVEYCEQNKEEAFRVNALGARNLSIVARRIKAIMVQMSTDDIFDGKSDKAYDEFDVPRPQTVYGKSKLAGENFVKDIAQKHLIIRSSWVYGNGHNFVTDFLEKAKTQKAIQVTGNQFASPTSAREVARCIYRLLREGEYGTYNATCLGFCSRYDFAKKIVEVTGLDVEIKQVLSPDSAVSMNRPSYAVLDNLMLRISGVETPVHWEEALVQYLQDKHSMEG